MHGLWSLPGTYVPCIGRRMLIHCATREVEPLIITIQERENEKREGPMLLLALWVLLTLLYVTLGEHVKGSHGQYWLFEWLLRIDWLARVFLLLITLSLLPGSVLIMISCSGASLYRYTLSPNTQSTLTYVVTHTSGLETFISFSLLMNSMSPSSVWMLKFLTIFWSINKINNPDFWYITSGWLRNEKSYLSVISSFSPLLLRTYLMEAFTVQW